MVALALAAAGAVAMSSKHPLWPVLAATAAAAAASLPLLRIFVQRHKRLVQFEQQLPDALDLMSRSLRVGNPLMDSFRVISDEMQPPISTEFGRLWSHVNYGVSLKAALLDLGQRQPSLSMRAMITAILVQRETGGNLAEVLDRVCTVLRSRLRFYRRVRTLSAEGRVSAFVLVVIPFILAGMLSVSSPTYLPMMLKDPLGQKLSVAAVVLMALGIFWITRIVRIRV
jgi:tight adherence protein B